MIEPLTERYIEVFEPTGERLITVIEFFSPSNKRGDGLKEFKAKREKLLAGQVNVVEIDLVRSGNWKELLRPHQPPKGFRITYRVTVRDVSDPVAVYFYPISIRKRLPTIEVPLRQRDKKVGLPLQPLIEQAHTNGRYAETIDYTQPLDPPLEGEDAAWAHELLVRAGRRPEKAT